MWAAIRASWPLFIGMIFLMVSNGLLTTLLTLRGSAIGFSDSVNHFGSNGIFYLLIITASLTVMTALFRLCIPTLLHLVLTQSTTNHTNARCHGVKTGEFFFSKFVRFLRLLHIDQLRAM